MTAGATDNAFAPIDTDITLDQLDRDPYPIYRRLRANSPVLRVEAANRTLLTKASDTKYVKDHPEIFSSDDPKTPMQRAYHAQTLMRKDGEAHLRERMAMAPAFSPRVIKGEWMPAYARIADEYLDRLPKGETVDLHWVLSSPYAARGLAELLGIPEATDDQMIYWSQTLINGAGNFGWRPEPFEETDKANIEMDALFDRLTEVYRANPNPSALSVMVTADDPIPRSRDPRQHQDRHRRRPQRAARCAVDDLVRAFDQSRSVGASESARGLGDGV